MWQHLPIQAYDEFLLSFNLLKTKDIKKLKQILYYLSNNIENHYIETTIYKKNGKPRNVYEPSPLLKNIQRNILHNVLIEKRISPYATAYKKGISLKDNALIHVNQKKILKLDIKDFFDNITFWQIYKSCFREELYPKSIGILLTKLTTYHNKLPQGAPSSPYISNIILRNFDWVIGKFCSINNINYTRYCDDLTFSGDFNTSAIIKIVKQELQKIHLKLNYKKIHIVYSNKCQIVTGIVVNKKINAKKEYRHKIRQEMYYIKKYGIDSHLKKKKIMNKKKYINSLIGKINYCLYLNKDYSIYREYLQELRNIK